MRWWCEPEPMFTILSVSPASSVDTGSVLETTSIFTITRWIYKMTGWKLSQQSLAGAVWPRLRGEDGLRLPLLPPRPACSTQAWVWGSAAAPAPLSDALPPPQPELPPAPRLLPYLLTSSSTNPFATHIISAILSIANLDIDREQIKIGNFPLLVIDGSRLDHLVLDSSYSALKKERFF